jgi:hypothetical protein
MTCDDARESLSALLDGALTPDERRAVEAHLEGCAECRRDLERLRQTVALLHRVSPAHAPVGFVDGVVAAAQPKPWYRRFAAAVLLPVSTKLPVEATAIVMVALLAVYAFERTPALRQAARYETPASSERVESPTRLTDARKEREVAPALRAAPPAVGPRSAEPRRDAPVARQSETSTARAPAAGPAPAAPPSPPPSPAPPAAVTDGAAAKAEAPAENMAGAEADSRRQALERVGAAGRVAPAAPGVAAKRAQPSADVVARVSVRDRDAAERNLAALIVQVGGRQTGSRREDDATIVEAMVPQSRYAEFSQAVGAIGSWRVEAERPDLPSQVHVILRLE